MLHVDIMDGHFVPNLTVGPPVVRSIRKITKMTLDVHLMVTDPDRYAPVFIEAGADQVSVHAEAARHLDGTLRLIQSEGIPAGVVLNPATPVSMLEDVLDLVDYVLVMSVNPGFGGQRFIPRALDKIRHLDSIRKQQRIEVRHRDRRRRQYGERCGDRAGRMRLAGQRGFDLPLARSGGHRRRNARTGAQRNCGASVGSVEYPRVELRLNGRSSVE